MAVSEAGSPTYLKDRVTIPKRGQECRRLRPSSQFRLVAAGMFRARSEP
jgi:hypothetical protein